MAAASDGSRTAERRSERLTEELLVAQGWDLRKPPAGELLTQHEYKDVPALKEALQRSSKKGEGPGVPEYVLVNREDLDPLAVFEVKARLEDIELACGEAQSYGDAFCAAGHRPLAVAVAGTKDERFKVRVFKHETSGWAPVTYEESPISWIPNRDQIERIRHSKGALDLRPSVPPPEVLKARAEEINGLLREAGLKDDFRPAAIGAIMLALWESHGDIRREAKYILRDINASCEKAFDDVGKKELQRSLRVNAANRKLAARAPRICQILERLNITSLTAEHDYLGALYEEFFRYTGGNTIGQYFTPRHITRLMADLCEVSKGDVVFDPACGTGGFLIAAMERMQRKSKLSREQIVETAKTQLIGIEDEPVTAALCVANMILRGDGSSGVRRSDAFEDSGFPAGEASVVLMNPPFPHKKTDIPPERFIDRALKGLRPRGQAAVVVPSSLLVKGPKAKWREAVLEENTLLGVISLPGELFQPYASATTAILIFEASVPHDDARPVFFCRISNDGLRLKKGTRVPQEGGQLDDVLANYRSGRSVPEFSGLAKVDPSGHWAPGAYIEARPLTEGEFRDEVATLIRNKVAFAARFAPQLQRLEERVAAGALKPAPYRKRGRQPQARPSPAGPTIGEKFEIYYGQKALHSKEWLTPGDALVISSSGADNGAYGFFEFEQLIKPPFVTVPSTGSIGEAAVQEFPCGVTDDCLLLFPKQGTPREALYVAAATLRRERWRFDYGRKMTPERIAGFPLRLDEELLDWVGEQWKRARRLEARALKEFGA